MDPFGQPIDKPVPLAVKMEELLRTAQRQRELHLERLKRRCGRAQAPPNNLRMTNADMKEIYNEWRKDVQSWMRESTLATYEELNHSCRHQEAHQLGKRTFSTYLFQLSGCKFLLHKLIELPLISQSSADSAEQPVTTLLADLINSYEEHKTTSKYQEEVRRSAEHQASQKRVSRQIWWAQYNYAQGRKLSDKVRDGVVDFFELDWKQQQLVEDFDTRRAARALDQLLEQKRPPYRGAGSEVTTYER